MKTANQYQRLPGKHKSLLGGYFHLWRGADHLLSVSYRFGDEYYKRFYYKDIQAIIVRKTAMGKIQNGVLISMVVFFSVMAFFTGKIGAWIFGGLDAAALLLLLINVLRGPTSESYIKTAVQTEKLNSLQRLNKAVKTMNMIKKRVEKTQGSLPAQGLQAALKKKPSETPNVAPQEAATPIRYSNSHLVLFIALTLLGLTAAFGFLHQTIVASMIENALFLTVAVVMVMALVKQYQSRIQGQIRMVAWMTVGYVSIYIICGYFYYIFFLIKHPAMRNNQWQLFKMMASVSPLSNPYLTGISLFTTGGALILGLWGLLLINRSRSMG